MISISKIITIPFILLLTIFAYFCGRLVLVEGYHPLEPLIDTYHRDDYSIQKFDRLKVGDTKQSAIDLVGPPLYNYTDTIVHTVTYYFTGDGKLLGKANDQNKREYLDFAWYRSSITVDSNEVIIDINKGWSYD